MPWTYTKNFNFFILKVKSTKKQLYSTNIKHDISPLWVTGYTDGDGSFILNVSPSKTNKIGYSVRLIYQLVAHSDDRNIMYKAQLFFKNKGAIIYTNNNKYVYYRISKFKDIIDIFIPHFTTYPLQSSKLKYFSLWCKAALLIEKKLHLTNVGFKELLTLKAAFNKGLKSEIFSKYCCPFWCYK